MTIFLGYQRCYVEAFKPSIVSYWRSWNEPYGAQVKQQMIYPLCGYKRRCSLVSMATSLVQDDTDSTYFDVRSRESYQRMQSGDLSKQSIKECKPHSIATLLKVLRTYCGNAKQHNKQDGNRDVENHILRLGRKGKTGEALQLYFAVHSLNQIRNLYRSKSMSLESKGKEIDAGSLLSEIVHTKMGWEISDNQQQEVSELQTLLEPLKNIRPTTRLLNLAIDACARAHPVQQKMAFDLFHSACVGEKSISPNVFTFGSLLASCARSRDIDTSLQLLHELEGRQYPDVVPNGVIYSTVISACERQAGALEHDGNKSSSVNNNMVDLALELLNNATLALSMDTSSGQNSEGGGGIGVVGFNAAISTMARQAEWRLAVQLLDEMIVHSKTTCQLQGPYINSTFAAPLLHVVNEEKYANKLFFIPNPDDVTFGTVLAACERAAEWEELLRIARVSKAYGVSLDGMALTSVLHACQQLGLADEALEYLELMKKLSNEGDEENNQSSAGRRTNGRMRKGAKQALRGPDGVAYRLAISACARSRGRWQDGLRLLDEMRKAAVRSNSTVNAPDVVAYTAAIQGCSEAGEYRHALKLIKTMKAEGIQPNVVTFSAVINCCASASLQLSKRRDEGDRSIEIDDVKLPMLKALKLLDAMRAPTSSIKPNIFTYNAAIRACGEGMNLDGAFDLLRQMKEDGLEPTIVTYGSLMTACERVGNVDAASKVFRMVKEQSEEDDEIRVNEIIYGAAISCCRKGGQSERALLLLRKMISDGLAPNTAVFNTVIAALSEGKSQSFSSDNNSLLEKALSVFKVMRSKHAPVGVKPNRITYNVLIKNLASNLQPGYAESLLDAMIQDGFIPDVDLYTLTVRSYEKCGNPRKALSLMESMREVGYDFYENKVFDGVFKRGVKILNSVAGNQKSSTLPFNEDMEFDGNEYDDRDDVFNSWR